MSVPTIALALGAGGARGLGGLPCVRVMVHDDHTILRGVHVQFHAFGAKLERPEKGRQAILRALT